MHTSNVVNYTVDADLPLKSQLKIIENNRHTLFHPCPSEFHTLGTQNMSRADIHQDEQENAVFVPSCLSVSRNLLSEPILTQYGRRDLSLINLLMSYMVSN
ncbi:hypothetical protein BaRGS_00039107 [Batillaria attramentaria]|uniref:Uncharacterized protein n=1 Tax=Batillaria attramentaria TaxID=370345 RepID=A0ABD0J3U8_9CAEN